MDFDNPAVHMLCNIMSENQPHPPVFKNSPARLALRDDFPTICENPKQLIQTLKSELIKTGTTLEAVNTIHIAYPHKIPALSGNWGDPGVSVLEEIFAIEIPGTWAALDALEDNVQLNRSKNRSSSHALSKRQVYSLNENFSFTSDNHGKKNFIVADHLIEQGSTLAELISAITYNGGHVLAAYSPLTILGKYLKQVTLVDPYEYDRVNKPVDLVKIFGDAATREGLPMDGQACLQKFDTLLKPLGMSIKAMTQGEKVKLSSELCQEGQTFTQLCTELENAAPKPAPGSTCCP